MDKKLLEELGRKLKKSREKIKDDLNAFAREDKKIKGDWDTKYPHFNSGVGSEAKEGAADEVEEYAELLPIEHSLELRLRDINLALEKIQKGNYGKCEKCGKEIGEERLKAYPEARFCRECEKR